MLNTLKRGQWEQKYYPATQKQSAEMTWGNIQDPFQFQGNVASQPFHSLKKDEV